MRSLGAAPGALAAHFKRITIGVMNTFFRGWQTPPSELVLHSGEVHIWLLLDDALAAATSRSAVLAQDEKDRASRMIAARSRAFVGSRAALRILLSRYTSESPETIAFSYGALGKPAFEPGGVHFSISHAGDRALLAFSRTSHVGIDLERVKDARRFDALTARFFSDANARTIALASPSGRARVFTEAWAEREAYVKAVGGGLYATPDALPFTPGRIPVREVNDPEGDAWMLATVPAGEEYEGKLAARGATQTLGFYTLAELPAEY